MHMYVYDCLHAMNVQMHDTTGTLLMSLSLAKSHKMFSCHRVSATSLFLKRMMAYVLVKTVMTMKSILELCMERSEEMRKKMTLYLQGTRRDDYKPVGVTLMLKARKNVN